MPTKKDKPLTPVELLQTMKAHGVEQVIPGTERKIRLRAVDAPTLLKEGKMPDILTPLVVKSIYQELDDKELRHFVGQQKETVEDALKHIDALNFIAAKTIADSTKVEDLTLAEKRWIFRLVMGPAELLVTFRYDPNPDVESLAEGEDVQSASE